MRLILRIKVWNGGLLLAEHTFDSDSHRRVTIGRLATAQLHLSDAKVSRIHAIIELTPHDAVIVDMGSQSGTLLNGTKVQRQKLASTDEIRIADTRYTVSLTHEDSVAVALREEHRVRVDPHRADTPPTYAPIEANDEPTQTDPSPEVLVTSVESAEHAEVSPYWLELRVFYQDLLLQLDHYQRPQTITLGEDDRSQIFASSEGLPHSLFPIIRANGNEFALCFCEGMEGEFEREGKLYSLDELRLDDANATFVQRDADLARTYYVPLGMGSKALIHWGGVEIAARIVDALPTEPDEVAPAYDLPYLNTLLVSVILSAVFALIMMLYPFDTRAVRVNLFEANDNRFATLILEAPKQTQSTAQMLERIKKSVEQTQQAQAVEAKQLPKAKGLAAKPKTETLRKPEAEKNISSRFSNILSGIGNRGTSDAGKPSGLLAGNTGAGSLSGAAARVIGTTGQAPSQRGLFGGGAGLGAGTGVQGLGAASGTSLSKSRGIAGIGTAGRLGGGKGQANYGEQAMDIGAKEEQDDLVAPAPTVNGGLAPEVIRKIISANRNQIRYCYELELQRRQDLEGRVVMTWVISKEGRVLKAYVKSSTLNNSSVEQCLVEKILAWRFPPPSMGNLVEVNYPFVFRLN